MPKPSFLRRLPAFLRMAAALGILALFIYACLSPGLASNGLLALLVKGQFSPALYGNGITAGIVIAILAITLLGGRFFCAVLCPLGTLQELIWRAGNVLRGKPRSVRSGYRPKIRYLIPLIAGAAATFAFSPLAMLFDPVSTFGRGAGAVRSVLGGNAAFFTCALALPLALILIAAFFRGRAFCDWCPVGLTLGLFSSAAPLGMGVSASCVSCGLCEKKCPAGCINSKEKRIDRERCVLCFSCAASCPAGSASYGPLWKGREKSAADAPDAPQCSEGRRAFLRRAGRVSLFCGAAYLLGPAVKLFPHAAVSGAEPSILPPGAKSLRHYQARCIGCQACAASCPVGIIKVRGPSLLPVLEYENSGCQFNCVECGKVCPTGAIGPLAVEDKRRTQVALSSLRFERCVVNTRHESCGACAEVCPTGAVAMTAFGESGVPWLTRPVLDGQYCIGCGACYVACPAEPKALEIRAVPEQSLTAGIRPGEDETGEMYIENTEDFPF